MGNDVPVDWYSLFVPQVPLLEIVVRGTAVYLALFFLLRFVLKRQSGSLAVTDLLVVVLIADAAQNAMADDYSSIADGVLLVGVVVFWAWALDGLGYRFPWFQRLIRPGKLPLVRDRTLVRHNMRKEFITEEELLSQLREQGVGDLGDVSAAYMEADGRISVLTRDRSRHSPRRRHSY